MNLINVIHICTTTYLVERSRDDVRCLRQHRCGRSVVCEHTTSQSHLSTHAIIDIIEISDEKSRKKKHLNETHCGIDHGPHTVRPPLTLSPSPVSRSHCQLSATIVPKLNPRTNPRPAFQSTKLSKPRKRLEGLRETAGRENPFSECIEVRRQ